MVKKTLLLFLFFTYVLTFGSNDFIKNERNFLKKNFKIKKSTKYVYNIDYDFKKAPFNELAFLGFFTLRLYQFFISSQDKDTCMFHPHCSLYAQISINKYGLVKGGIMSASRLLRCNGVGGSYYYNIAPDGKIIDPPDRNYLWKK